MGVEPREHAHVLYTLKIILRLFKNIVSPVYVYSDASLRVRPATVPTAVYNYNPRLAARRIHITTLYDRIPPPTIFNPSETVSINRIRHRWCAIRIVYTSSDGPYSGQVLTFYN